jgi:hypothetical protein
MDQKLWPARHCTWSSLGYNDSTDVAAFFHRLADKWEEDLPEDLSVLGMTFQREDSERDQGPFLWVVTLFLE